MVAATRSGALRCEDVARACLDRIAIREPVVNAWSFLDPDLVMQQAQALDRATHTGALHGMPIGVKDACGELVEHAGRVEEVVFDCNGRIEGFVIGGCCDHRAYVTRESGLTDLVLRACRDRLDLVVFSPRHRPGDVARIVVRA